MCLTIPVRFASDARIIYDNMSDVNNPREFAQGLFRIVSGLQRSNTPFGNLVRRLGLARLVRLIGENPIRQLFLTRPSAEEVPQRALTR